MEAFSSYDFGSDPRWQQYRAQIEIPFGRDEQSVLHKYKAKWYKREVDPDFDVAAAIGGPAPKPAAQTSGNGKSSAQTDHQKASEEQPGATSSNGGPDASPPSQSRAKGLRQRLSLLFGRGFKLSSDPAQLLLFILHVTLVALAALSVQPVNRRLSRIAWVYFLQVSVLSHGFKVYLAAGLPHLRPFLDGIKSWLMRVGHTSDFQYMFYSIIFLPQEPLSLALVPITILAVYHAFAFSAKNFRNNRLWKQYGAKAHAFLAAHQRDALFYNASAEVGVGVALLVFLLTPRRAVFNTFAYWNWLRMRYHFPDSSAYQTMVWNALDQKVGVYARQSILNVPLGFVQRWFQSGGR